MKLILQRWQENNNLCPFCQSSDIEEYDSGSDDEDNIRHCFQWRDCDEEWDDVFEPFLSVRHHCPDCHGDNISDDMTIMTHTGFVNSYHCLDCSATWETEFIYAGICYNEQLYRSK